MIAATLTETTKAFNASRTDDVRGELRARSCLYGLGYVCECCGPRTTMNVVLSTNNTRKGVGAQLARAARDFAARLPTGTKITRDRLPLYYYGQCSFPLSTSLRLTVAITAEDLGVARAS